MSEISLEHVLSVNEELAALSEAGVPSNLGEGDLAVARQVKQINSSLTLRSSLGQPLIDATAQNDELPKHYRDALQAGLRSNQLSATLDSLCQRSAKDESLRGTIGRSLISPLIIAALAYIGFLVLCLYYSPAVEGLYAQSGEAPSWATNILVAFREWLPVWSLLLLFAVIAGVFSWKRGWRSWLRWIPGAKSYTEAIRNADFSRQLRLLIENEVSLAEGLPIAAKVTGDQEFIQVAEVLADAHANEVPVASDNKSLRALPPVLCWALTGDLGDQSLPEILRFAEATYRRKAERRMESLKLVLPAAIGAFLGGAIVLVYGLSLFGTFAQLLEDIASN